ncbi:ABC transporter substrate-binding protein [Kibdelosporangium phytohabitans]|uniref:Peptide ABC transporter substrate-binding protein n=1 Tax=Kibdelosporangium phytohabitans TaxID=860235 RepID=A0A0N9HX35_9PSEU|nr:ABC transporter substrate-binding protein [Kibdelosporangium phytohabitans]ALG09827.1 peptide ABC transporter substrate-binding protein [Kibdelosporangium phytohabitans]MBE1468785.1 peptide/nickel transport system substrate-binding protein [Kibdelosporangium phytohabitans]
MRKARLTAAIASVVALTVSACGATSQSGGDRTANQKLADGKTFTMGIPSDPGSLDPAMTVLAVALQLDRFLYDGLIDLDASGKPIPNLAEKFEATTTTAAFTLRDGITCADGAPLTASDVAANINFVGDPANKSAMLGLSITPGTKAVADDAARTVTLTSGAPDAFLLRNAGSLPIVCGKGLADRSALAKGQHGTGMFTMTELVPNDHYTLTRRKDYAWGPGQWQREQPGLPDKVVIRVVPNNTTAANLLLSRELNAATITGQDQQRLRAQKLFHGDFLAPMGELFFNQAPGRAGKDPAVRRALVQALDLGQIGKVLTSGNGQPAKGLVTAEPLACSADSVSGKLPAFDVAAAKAGLDAAGWLPGPDGVRVKDGKRLTLTAIYGQQLGPTMASGAELMQQSWKSVGAEVTLKAVDSPGTSQVLFGTGEWDISMAPLGFVLPSQAVPFMSGSKPPAGTNFAHIENAEFATLVKQAASMPGEAGCATWAAAESALVSRLDVVPFVHTVIPIFGSDARFDVVLGSIVPSTIRMYS